MVMVFCKFLGVDVYFNESVIVHKTSYSLLGKVEGEGEAELSLI